MVGACHQGGAALLKAGEALGCCRAALTAGVCARRTGAHTFVWQKRLGPAQRTNVGVLVSDLSFLAYRVMMAILIMTDECY